MSDSTICGIGADGIDSGVRCGRPDCVRCNGMHTSAPQTTADLFPTVEEVGAKALEMYRCDPVWWTIHFPLQLAEICARWWEAHDQ